MGLRALARMDSDKTVCPGDSGRIAAPYGRAPLAVNEDGKIVNQQRILYHPTLDALEYEPSVTVLGFIRDIAIGTDTNIIRTVGGNVMIERSQLADDGTVSEIWFGGDNIASTYAEFVRDIWLRKNTALGVGEYMTWHPLDLTTKGYKVRIASVTIGSPQVEYREIKEALNSLEDALITSQLTVTYKVFTPSVAPQASITLAGV